LKLFILLFIMLALLVVALLWHPTFRWSRHTGLLRRSTSLLMLILALPFALAACSSTTTTTPVVTSTGVANLIQQGVQTACGYQVDIDTAVALAGTVFPVTGPIDAAVAAVVQGVCSALLAQPPAAASWKYPAKAAAPPVYKGVPIVAKPFKGS